MGLPGVARPADLQVKAEKIWSNCRDKLKDIVGARAFSTWIEPVGVVGMGAGSITLVAPHKFHVDYWEKNIRPAVQGALKDVEPEIKTFYLVVKEIKNETVAIARKQPHKRKMLQDEFTFDNFVEGSGNQFAKTAAWTFVTNQNGTRFNPLFVYGMTGLGKTHLLQSIGNQAVDQNPRTKVCYITSEKFFRDFINSISNKTTTQFSTIYRNVDVLLVDDVQFFQKKEGTQEQFFHTFNELLQKGKQIVLSSDRAPKDILGIEERLLSRFQSGLVVDIQPPDFETRIAILQQKANQDALDIPYEVLEYIATKIQTNVRELFGAIVRLLARSLLYEEEITLDLAKREIVKISPGGQSQKISIESIQETTAAKFGFNTDQIIGKGRRKELALARQIAMYLSREMTECSLKTIGLHFGGRDHSTIIHACKQIGSLTKSGGVVKTAVEDITSKLAI